MTTLQIELPPEIYRRLVTEATRLGKPVQLVAQEWLIERTGLADFPATEPDEALALLRNAGLLAKLSAAEQARAAACSVTLEEIQESLSRSGGKPLSEIIIEQRGPKE